MLDVWSSELLLLQKKKKKMPLGNSCMQKKGEKESQSGVRVAVLNESCPNGSDEREKDDWREEEECDVGSGNVQARVNG